MQNTGTLKKRKKRNIAKVKGLGTIPYNEAQDEFIGRTLFNKGGCENENRIVSRSRTRCETILRMNSAPFSNQRITRNPNFHQSCVVDVEVDEGYKFQKSYRISPSLRRRMWSQGESFNENENDLMPIQGRDHFLDPAAMNRLQLLIFLGVATGCFPWRWNSKSVRIDIWKSSFLRQAWKLQWLLVTIQICSLTIYQFYSFFHAISVAGGKTNSYRETFMSSFSVVWYSSAVYFNVNLYLYRDQTRQYINTLLRINKELVEKYLIHLDGHEDGGRVVINGAIPSNCVQVFISVTLFLVMPFQPWYLFSYVYPKPWYWLIPGAIQEFVVVGQVITSYLLTCWLVVAHTNSVHFWLMEIHKEYDSDFTRDTIRHPKVALEIYRALQVLCTCFNDCLSPLALPMVKFLILTAMIPCGYVLIRSMDHKFIEEFPGILTYPLGVFDCVTAGYAILKMASEMFDLSSSFIDSWSRTKKKDFRRFLMSCPCLKVKVGRFYFITVSTTITFFKAIFDLITDCIITFP